MVENKLVSILESLDLEQEYDVMLQGTLSSQDYEPENYFTYWCWDNARGEFYDNKPNKNDVGYQIIAYSTDRNFLIKMMKEAIKKLEVNDFIIDDDEIDVASNDKIHTAKMIDVYFILKKEE